MSDHGIRGPVALPGEPTPDGVVVPAQAGASPVTLAVVAVGVVGLSLVFAGMVFVALQLGFTWAGLAAVAAAGLLVLLGTGRALFRPNGLRVGARDVALLRGSRVVWRRGLHEIARVELDAGGEYVRLFAADGEVRGASLGSLWDQPGAADAVVAHLQTAVERARHSPEALADPDARLVELVGSVRPHG